METRRSVEHESRLKLYTPSTNHDFGRAPKIHEPTRQPPRQGFPKPKARRQEIQEMEENFHDFEIREQSPPPLPREPTPEPIEILPPVEDNNVGDNVPLEQEDNSKDEEPVLPVIQEEIVVRETPADILSLIHISEPTRPY